MEPAGPPHKTSATPGRGQGGPDSRHCGSSRRIRPLLVQRKSIATLRSCSRVRTYRSRTPFLASFHRGGLAVSYHTSVREGHRQKGILRVLLFVLDGGSVGDAGFLEFYSDSEASLFCYEDNKSGVATGVAEVLQDGLCVQDRASRTLPMTYSISEGKESESRILALGPTVRTHRLGGKSSNEAWR